MPETPGTVLERVIETEAPAAELQLLIPYPPHSREFLQNLRDWLRPGKVAPLELKSSPAAFWPDVFVRRELPWRRFMESGLLHVVALALILGASRFFGSPSKVTVHPAFDHSDVVLYSATEYLPPLDTRQRKSTEARKADPELSAQAIISVPPEADNRSQTIVAAPKVKLQHDVPVPNTIAWSDAPRMPIAPTPVIPASEITRLTPRMDRSVIAPPTSLDQIQNAPQKTMTAPPAAVIAPPPSLDAASNRRLGELNVGPSTVIAPAPQLPLDEQRTLSGARAGAVRGQGQRVIAPPPSVGTSGGSRAGGGMIALNLHPAVGAPPSPAPGYRRGSFAATPEGHRGASGAPGSSTAGSSANGSGPGKGSTGNLPAGLYVGKNSSDSVNPNLLHPNPAASSGPSRASTPLRESDSKLSEAERAVFGGRKVYSLSLNMPNLNSAGGSWIIRFAALKPDSAPSTSPTEATSSDLSSPVATRKVDPAYPLELMRQNVGGTVILYAIIHADGTVGSIRVLRSVDDRLDHFASDAIGKWKFQPAMKNDAPVDVEATFWIPFRPARTGSSF
jgi:TonB family protein